MSIQIKNLKVEKPKSELDIRVDRRYSVLANPFFLECESLRNIVCNRYVVFFKKQLKINPDFKAELDRLVMLYKIHGTLNLFCWCAPLRCHAETIRDYILEACGELPENN